MCPECLDALAPDDPSSCCAHCGQALAPAASESRAAQSGSASGGCICCRKAPPCFDAAASFGVYDGNLRRLIHLLKYEKMLPLAEPLAARMACRLEDLGKFDAVVPVPLHWRKQWSRGFNQAALLAKRLAGQSGAAFFPRALRRVRPTAVQAGLSDSERVRNMRGAFAARDAHDLEGCRVLLVDDVMTTGATLGAAAEALKAAGASYVATLTLARAVRQSRVGAS